MDDSGEGSRVRTILISNPKPEGKSFQDDGYSSKLGLQPRDSHFFPLPLLHCVTLDRPDSCLLSLPCVRTAQAASLWEFTPWKFPSFSTNLIPTGFMLSTRAEYAHPRFFGSAAWMEFLEVTHTHPIQIIFLRDP